MSSMNFNDIPTAAQFEKEMKRLKYKQNFRNSVKSTVSALITIVAVAVILSTMLIPVLRVTGTSMTPTLQNDEYVLCSKVSTVKQGDIIAFYYNNRILLKRVIGVSGDVIDISDDGTVTLNDKVLDEPYISEKALGECDIELPYQVPENRLFVMGDHRSVSVDSRSTSVGCVAEENIVGKVMLRIWPLKEAGRPE
ncbi:MAG: Signal peptidase IB [Firmicutes bacterium ADurb.BinA205]|nr:MAG: Signal peptidase IB [Firmicutes bacterium ADurb.BinA205]